MATWTDQFSNLLKRDRALRLIYWGFIGLSLGVLALRVLGVDLVDVALARSPRVLGGAVTVISGVLLWWRHRVHRELSDHWVLHGAGVALYLMVFCVAVVSLLF